MKRGRGEEEKRRRGEEGKMGRGEWEIGRLTPWSSV